MWKSRQICKEDLVSPADQVKWKREQSILYTWVKVKKILPRIHRTQKVRPKWPKWCIIWRFWGNCWIREQHTTVVVTEVWLNQSYLSYLRNCLIKYGLLSRAESHSCSRNLELARVLSWRLTHFLGWSDQNAWVCWLSLIVN